MRKKKYFIWILIILIIGSLAYYWREYLPFKIFNSSSGKTNSEHNTFIENIDPRTVIEVGRGSIKNTVSTSGYIKPVNEVYLSFASTGTTGGTVEKILVKRGEMVQKSQELVKLEDKQEHLNYLKAMNEYELAKITGSPSQIEEKKLTMEVAQDRYESKTLPAPFYGKIVDIFVEEGDFIEGTHDVVYLIDDSSYEVSASIGEIDVLKVAVGQMVEIELDILKGQIFHGTVVEVAEYAHVEGGVVSVPVTLRMNEVSTFFKPGFSATAEIITDMIENVLIVPVTALSMSGGTNIVLKVDGNKAIPIPVKAGIADGFYQEISEGLQEGDKIVINSYQINNSSQNSRGGFRGIGGNAPIPMMR